MKFIQHLRASPCCIYLHNEIYPTLTCIPTLHLSLCILGCNYLYSSPLYCPIITYQVIICYLFCEMFFYCFLSEMHKDGASPSWMHSKIAQLDFLPYLEFLALNFYRSYENGKFLLKMKCSCITLIKI